MTSDTSRRQPNNPIFLEDISITHINGHVLAVPCSASVTLHLSPTISCRIAADNLPIDLVDLQYIAFSITTSNDCTTKVSLRYNSNDFFYSRVKKSFKGFLIPYKMPCTVFSPNTKIRSVSFSVLNFPEFSGQKDKWIDGKSSRLGVAILEHENLRIEIMEDTMFSENRKLLNKDDGYFVTHAGVIQYCDGNPLSVAEAEHIIRGLRALLSFARGSACGITLVKAINQNDDEIVIEWGINHTEPWNRGGTAWLPVRDGGDSLSQLFPGFWDLYNNSDWRDTVSTVIDWYINCNSSPFHIGVILAQAALESLAYKIVGEKNGMKTAEWLGKMLKNNGIDVKIPDSCYGLKELSNAKKVSGNDDIWDGPRVLTEIRNDLVHSKKEHGHISAEAQLDAQSLGCWYIELIMLKTFGYHGRYKNHLIVAGENPYENVP